MVDDIEKEYSKLCKKYKLPKFKELDEEFEISSLENTNFLLSNILRKVGEKIEFYANLINDLLQPDTSSLSSMHEIRFFADKEKNNIYDLFKRLMKVHRNAIVLALEHDGKNQAKFLNDFLIEWLNIKKQLLVYVGKMKDSWDKETTMEENLGYFG
ncbi:hypothetical protein CMO93_02835 [Candidatus Woesearchaeota archaeon]|nr:hypothetical protein [Candidatus Woesearchaeota archaeon]|tara:strand:- start:1832 stop:2299 length:468 start_codon:yes stop_codon:yes gene_type:complete